MYENRKYVIMTLTDINAGTTDNGNNIYIDAVIQKGIGSLRKTVDGSKALLKWDGDTPSCFDGLTTYTHSEIKTELAKSEWTGE